eukprot:1320430-Amorphochlora_amoeboformis.AAC.1
MVSSWRRRASSTATGARNIQEYLEYHALLQSGRITSLPGKRPLRVGRITFSFIWFHSRTVRGSGRLVGQFIRPRSSCGIGSSDDEGIISGSQFGLAMPGSDMLTVKTPCRGMRLET